MAVATMRALDKIERLSEEPRSLVTFWNEAADVLDQVVPHFGFPCWYTLDPASLLITSHYNPEMPELPRESLAEEYYGDDVNQIVDVARSSTGVSTLHDAAGGDPSGSPRWQANIALGGDQEYGLTERERDVDLVATVFFTHYEPRLRDNERRTAQDKPARGGPVGSA